LVAAATSGEWLRVAFDSFCHAKRGRSNCVLIPGRVSSRLTAGLGGKGIRTPGLLIANETLYQLSYTP